MKDYISLFPRTRCKPLFRRIGRGLRSSSGISPLSELMVSSFKNPLYQDEETKGRSFESMLPGTSSVRSNDKVILRHNHSSRLYLSSKRDLPFASQLQGEKDPLRDRNRPLSPPSAVHRGGIQYSDGHIESSEPSHTVRMDSPQEVVN